MKSRWIKNRRGGVAPQIILLAAGLVAGVLVGAVIFRSAADPAAEPALPQSPTAAAKAAPNADVATLTAERDGLQSRVKELDQAISDRDRIITRLRAEIRDVSEKSSAEEVAKETEPEKKPGQRDWKDRPKSLAEMKEKDPEGYARIQERIQGFTGRMTETMTNQGDFLESLDQALMTEEQRENHQKLQETLAGIQTTMEKLKNGELDNGDTWAMRREMMGTMKNLGPMLEMERKAAISQVGHGLGYEKEAERTEFVEYMDHVYEMTSPGTIWKSMMGDGGPGGRGRGPGGRGGPAGQDQDKK